MKQALKQGPAVAIANAVGIKLQIAEASLVFLEKWAYVDRANANGRPARGTHTRFSLSPKGARYLQGRGLQL